MTVRVIFKDGPDQVEAAAEPGDTLLRVAHRAGIDLEGACGGQMACATCHLHVDKGWLKRLAPPSPEELDMLELAEHWRPNSRLGCQIRMTAALDGLIVALPPL
ncbi:MAG: 2Fe-2S iron-sulfur cluster-binding protein [Rhodothalassiaceae bacterium]